MAEVIELVPEEKAEPTNIYVYCCPECDYSDFYLIAKVPGLESFFGFQCQNEDCGALFKFPLPIKREDVSYYIPEE
jgi:hypothetical protein